MHLGGGFFFLLLFFFATVVVADFLSFLVTFLAVDGVVVVPLLPYPPLLLSLLPVLILKVTYPEDPLHLVPVHIYPHLDDWYKVFAHLLEGSNLCAKLTLALPLQTRISASGAYFVFFSWGGRSPWSSIVVVGCGYIVVVIVVVAFVVFFFNKKFRRRPCYGHLRRRSHPSMFSMLL